MALLSEMTAQRSCGSCRYYNAEWHQCRRRAPVAHGDGTSCWPHVDADEDYCGEYDTHTPF